MPAETANDLTMPNEKNRNGPTKKYSDIDLVNAIEACQNGLMNQMTAAKHFNIPRSTLILKLKGWKGRSKSTSTKVGRPTELSEDVERDLVANINTMNKWGYGLSKKEVLNVVSSYIKSNEVETSRFKNERPGKDWFLSFQKRWKLSCKKPVKREKARIEQTTPEIIYGFFDDYSRLLNELILLDKPNQIFNLDETSFCHDPNNTKVVAGKGKHVFRRTSGTGRTNTSVLCCVSASGNKLPPYIIFKGKSMWSSWMSPDAFPNTGYAVTQNGWMTVDAFFSWFKLHFLKHCPKERPLLVIFDGHTSHISPQLIKLAIKEKVTLLKLPPHTTHLLQPLDSTAFKSLKVSWDENLTIWQRENQGQPLGKQNFSKLLGNAWAGLPVTVIKKGFALTGLYDERRPENPVNKDAIKKSEFSDEDLHNYQKKYEQIDQVAGNSQGDTETQNVPINDVIEKDTATIHADIEQQSGTCKSGDSNQRKSFEDLLLDKVGMSTSVPEKRKKIAKFAEVITREEYLRNLEIYETEKNNKKKNTSKKPKPIKKRVASESSDTSDDRPIEYMEDSDSPIEFCDEDNLSLSREVPEGITLERNIENDGSSNESSEPLSTYVKSRENIEKYNERSLEVGQWVVVTYASKKTLKRFVGQIIGILEEVTVKFLKRNIHGYFIWPEQEDIDTVPHNEIFRIIPEPVFDRRGRATLQNINCSELCIC